MTVRCFALLTSFAVLGPATPAHAVPAELVGNTIVCPVPNQLSVIAYVTRRTVYVTIEQMFRTGIRFDLGKVRNERMPTGASYRSIGYDTGNGLDLIADIHNPALNQSGQVRFQFTGGAGNWRVTAALSSMGGGSGSCRVQQGNLMR